MSDAPPAKSGLGSLWLWVAAGFLFIACLWVAMFLAAREANIQSVPLVKQGGKP